MDSLRGELAQIDADYAELFDFYGIPNDGRNRMRLAEAMNPETARKIRQEVQNRIYDRRGEEHGPTLWTG